MTVKTEMSRDQIEALYDAAIYMMQREDLRAHLYDAAINLRLDCGMDREVFKAIDKVNAEISCYQKSDMDMLESLKESQAKKIAEQSREIDRLKKIDNAIRDHDFEKAKQLREKFAKEALEETIASRPEMRRPFSPGESK